MVNIDDIKRHVASLRRMFRPDGQEELEAPPTEEASFVLSYGELEVGTLQLSRGKWQFRYSRAFRAQDTVKPLVEFPDVDETYVSEDLWPFFLARIPSVSQRQVREMIDAHLLDQTNMAQLLRAFGERSISNPFLLKSA